jgi:glycosyltransferase involved in cell wall biosynthesis
MTKIVAMVRTLNEEKNIGFWINAYAPWVDHVIVADGGSNDATVSIVRASQEIYPNVHLRFFMDVIWGKEGVWRNPEGKHINFLLDWAAELKADWVIFDDCDCRPNKFLRAGGRDLIEQEETDFILITRLYLWKDTNLHIENLAQPAKLGVWEPSLWAWRLSSGLRANSKVDWDIGWNFRVDQEPRNALMPPYCLLHRPWPDESSIRRKMNLYNNSYWADGEPRQFAYPRGRLALLPEWAVE